VERGIIRIRKTAARAARRLPWTARVVSRRRRRTRERVLEQMPAGSRCAEIGVWQGDFSQMILDVVRPSELHLIDPWMFVPEAPNTWFGGRVAQDQEAMDEIYRAVVERFAMRPEVVIHRATSVVSAQHFEPGALDWVYIDGDHRLDAVRSDLASYLPLIRASGYVTGDDYLWRDEGAFPVKVAVDECIRTGVVDLVAVFDSQFILRKR
jgi:hypothetical protein